MGDTSRLCSSCGTHIVRGEGAHVQESQMDRYEWFIHKDCILPTDTVIREEKIEHRRKDRTR